MLRSQSDRVTAVGSRSGSWWRGQVQSVLVCIFVSAREACRGFMMGGSLLVMGVRERFPSPSTVPGVTSRTQASFLSLLLSRLEDQPNERLCDVSLHCFGLFA